MTARIGSLIAALCLLPLRAALAQQQMLLNAPLPQASGAAGYSLTNDPNIYIFLNPDSLTYANHATVTNFTNLYGQEGNFRFSQTNRGGGGYAPALLTAFKGGRNAIKPDGVTDFMVISNANNTADAALPIAIPPPFTVMFVVQPTNSSTGGVTAGQTICPAIDHDETVANYGYVTACFAAGFGWSAFNSAGTSFPTGWLPIDTNFDFVEMLFPSNSVAAKVGLNGSNMVTETGGTSASQWTNWFSAPALFAEVDIASQRHIGANPVGIIAVMAGDQTSNYVNHFIWMSNYYAAVYHTNVFGMP